MFKTNIPGCPAYYFKLFSDFAVTNEITNSGSDFTLPITQGTFAAIQFQALTPGLTTIYLQGISGG